MAPQSDTFPTASLGSALASGNETVNTDNQAVALARNGKDIISVQSVAALRFVVTIAPMNSNAILAPTVPEMPIASGVIMDSRRNAHIASATELPIRSTEAASASYDTNTIWHETDIEGSSAYQAEGNGSDADKERHAASAQGEAYDRQAQSATTETQEKQSMVITLKVRCPLNARETQERGEVMSLKTKHQNQDQANEEKPENMQSSTAPQAANISTRTMITRSLAVTAPILVTSEAESSTARAPRPRPRPDKRRRTEDFDEEPRHRHKRLKR